MGFLRGGVVIEQRVALVGGWPAQLVARLARRGLEGVSLTASQLAEVKALIDKLESLGVPALSEAGGDEEPPGGREVTVKEAAALLGVGDRQARNLVKGMSGRRVGRAWLVDAAEVEALAEWRQLGDPVGDPAARLPCSAPRAGA